MEFIEKVNGAIDEFDMLSGADTVVAALSGGADSVSLLLALADICRERGLRFAACHLNHGLRGAESDRDESFCRELCERLDIELFSERVDVLSARGKHESTEQTARRLRYRFFEQVLARCGRNAVLASAHTASDNAETVIFNLTRGTGLSGLCGIPPVRTFGADNRRRIIRPLIGCAREDVEEFLRVRGQEYVTDSTNLSDEYSRNRIRLNVIPELKKLDPSLLAVITRASALLREDEEYLAGLADNALSAAKRGRGWEAAVLAGLPKPVRSRALRKILISGGIEPSKQRIDAAAAILRRRSARYNPCKDKFFTIRKGICYTEDIEQVLRKNTKKDTENC